MKTYDPKNFPLVFAGILVEGFADGSFITVEETTPAFSSVVGAYGDVTRARSHDRRFQVRIVLQQTSETNGDLSRRYRLDKEGPNGIGVGSLSLVDLFGNTLIASPEAYIVGQPSATWDVAPTNREWTIECASGEFFLDGQPSL